MWPLCEKGKLDPTDKMGEDDVKSHISISSYSVGRCVFPPRLTSIWSSNLHCAKQD